VFLSYFASFCFLLLLLFRMNYNEVGVLLVLAVCCFVANVLHGLTGCGSILVLHALWQTAVTLTPEVLHNTAAFGEENVKSIAEFSYVLTFFIQIVLTSLLFFDERQKRIQQQRQGVPATPSELNGVLLLAFIPCSFVGAAVGLYTMSLIHENGSRIILGGSSLFFALTFLSLYQMKYLERKKTEDVIRDDLMLMRIQSEVQRHVILQYMEAQKRRRMRKERRHRHRAQRLQAKKDDKARRRALRLKTLAITDSTNVSSSPSAAAAAATMNGEASTPLVIVPPGEKLEGGIAGSMSELERAPLELNVSLQSPSHIRPQQHSLAAAEPLTSIRTNRPLEVHGSSHVSSPDAHMISDVHLPASLISGGVVDDAYAAGQFANQLRRRHHYHRFWVNPIDVQTYIRVRLAEISRNVDSPSEEVAHEAQLAAWTLRAMGGLEADADVISPYPASPARQGANSSISSSSTSTSGDDDSTITSTTASAHPPYAPAKHDSKVSQAGTDSELGASRNPHARTVRFDTSAEATAEREELHKKWKVLLGKGNDKDGDESIDLSKSIAMAAATAPRRVVMGHTEILNIGLREAQQQQLKSLKELNSSEYSREHHRRRIVHFIRMDGGVVMSAMVSSFFSGLLGSYTGVADPPLMIFVLAMGISVPELRINYAVSSIIPAALRAVVGIADGFANKSLFVYYLVSVLFAWGGVAFGLHISHHTAVTHITFMIATVAILLLVAFLMLVPFDEVLLRLGATAACFIVVAFAIFRQQKKPEHRRPPAPPNTPATAAEVEAFEQYWRLHSRKQQALVDYENDGSAVSMNSNNSALLEESVRSGTSSGITGIRSGSARVPPTPGMRSLPKQQTEASLRARSARLETEDLPARARQDDAEELITIVPVKAITRV
jgi:Ca2+/Na+ antiporter